MNPDILFPAPSQGVVKSKSPHTSIASHTSHASLASLANEAVSVPLTRTQALQYLHREALILPPDTPKGIVIVTYRNLPLGYAKNIGSRANNLYPQEWRIRKQI